MFEDALLVVALVLLSVSEWLRVRWKRSIRREIARLSGEIAEASSAARAARASSDCAMAELRRLNDAAERLSGKRREPSNPSLR